jgi:magnesium transporter
MAEKTDPTLDVFRLIEDEQWDDIAREFAVRHPADIAAALDNAESDERERLFSLVPADIRPDVLCELHEAAIDDVLSSLSDANASALIENMSPDDAADVLAHLEETRHERVLSLMRRAESQDVRELLKYEADTAGGIMTTDVIAMREDQTVDEALHEIAYFDEREPFFYANIVDSEGRMLGYVDIWELLRERNRSKRLRELVHDQFAAATVDMDQEEVARLMAKYDLAVVPVLDQRGVLVGRVTADDVMDVMEEEASEDIFRLAGSDDAELEGISTIQSCAVRLPWLFVTLLGGFAVSLILKEFHTRIADMLVLAAFVPILLAMGGNTGIQSSTLIVRGLAVGTLEGRSVFRLILRELATGAIMGSVCGIVIGCWAFLVAGHGVAAPALAPVQVAMVVAAALFTAMTFASAFGTLVPLMLNRVHVDPAVASGPFITIANDVAASLIYFGVTILLTHHLATA